MKKTVLFILLILLAGGAHYAGFNLAQLTDYIPELSITSAVTTVVEDQGDIEVFFCPHQDCVTPLVNFINSAETSVHCALFELDQPDLQQAILQKEKEIEVLVVTDDQYLYEFDHDFVRTDTWGLQHNKFCIIDGKKVSTGSMNPTVNGATKNNNNLLLINSQILAQNYEAEFQEMWGGTFKKGDTVLNPIILISDSTVKNYFCPEDNCADQVEKELEKAESSIYFMTFSFTHEGIANKILLKHADGIEVKGVMEARQVSKYSRFNVLSYQTGNVYKDANKANMHHKVFIVDEKVVVTGSFNPSASGDSRNDENLLIIENAEVAKKYVDEFERLYKEGKEKVN
jgi:phosphatidylserine/phosphatidylglycerophosphate/cardiolipin synthase-like enzyme